MAALDDVKSILVDKSIDHQTLNASRSEFQKSRLSATGQRYDKVVIGAAAFRYASKSSKSPTLLLLKRAPHEHLFPNVFEIPGGKVDPEDLSIKHAIAREVREETGLRVKEIIGELAPMRYSTDRTMTDENGQSVQVSRSAIQLNYVVSVSDDEAVLSPDDHSESLWATKEDVDGLDMTSEMRVVVREAYAWAASRRAHVDVN